MRTNEETLKSNIKALNEAVENKNAEIAEMKLSVEQKETEASQL